MFVDHCVPLFKFLSNHVQFITNGYKRFSKTNSKATGSFKAVFYQFQTLFLILHKHKKATDQSNLLLITFHFHFHQFHAILRFIYGCETWTLTSRLEKRLDDCYTRMLRCIQQIHWQRHITNLELYSRLPRVSNKISTRRLRLAGHCLRHGTPYSGSLFPWQTTNHFATGLWRATGGAVYSNGRPTCLAGHHLTECIC